MKVLFITSAAGVDYEADCVFHGLVDAGHDVVDSKYLWYLSVGMDDKTRRSLYGKGFTIAGNLPDRSTVNRIGLEDRIASHEFDAVVYGSVHRCRDYMDLVTAHYGKHEIAAIDGEDHQYVIKEVADGCTYFKRELYDASVAKPISFAVPECKFVLPIHDKTKIMATVVPGKKETYVFDDEKAYYDDYASSMYGLTFKKAGWDCLRHYEIIAAGCMPLFTKFESCPKSIMVNWPWHMQSEANRIYGNGVIDVEAYKKLLPRFVAYAKTNLTTKALAEYVISSL